MGRRHSGKILNKGKQNTSIKERNLMKQDLLLLTLINNVKIAMVIISAPTLANFCFGAHTRQKMHLKVNHKNCIMVEGR